MSSSVLMQGNNQSCLSSRIQRPLLARMHDTMTGCSRFVTFWPKLLPVNPHIYGFTNEELEFSLDNLVRRQLLSDFAVKEILPRLKAQGLFAPDFQPSIEPRPIANQVGKRVYALEGVHEPWIPEHIDYLNEFR